MTRPVKRKSWLPILPLAIAAFGCSDRTLEDEAPRDPVPPELNIITPERGLIAGQGAVNVTGRVRDDQSGVASVTVNGVNAPVESDGRFEASINVSPGLTLLQTTAIDVAGNESIDTRAVLAGELAPHDQTVREAMAAHLSPETFSIMSDVTAGFVNRTDLGVLAQAANPVYRNGGCLGAEIDVETIEKSGVNVSLVPVGGGLDVVFSLDNLVVTMDADFEVACIGGSAGVELSANKFTMSGKLDIKIVNGLLEVDLLNTQAAFQGFDLDVGSIPSAVVNLFEDSIEDNVVDTLRAQATTLIPQLATDFLGGLSSSAFELPVFGRTMSLTIVPTVAEFTPDGGTIALDSNIFVKDAFGPGYVFTPASMPSVTELQGAGQAFRFAMADDTFNQALASMHASGMLEQSFVLSDDNSGSGIGDFADRLDLHLLLPPVVRADLDGGIVEIVVGDLLIDIVDIRDDETELVVTRAAISGRIQLQVNVQAGALKLQTMTPELWIDLVDDGVSGPNPLAYSEVEKLATIGSARVANVIDEMLSGLPIPVFGGTTIGETTFEPSSGYVVVGGSLTQVP